MSNYPNQYKSGETQTDEYGNPIHHGSTGTKTTGYQQETAGGYGAGGTEFGTTHHTGGHGTGGTFTGTTAAGHGQTHHRRSGSGSSSSSEDDGQGGRRKKGLKEKIKDKLPGGHKDERQQGQGQYPSGTTTTTTPGGGYYEQSGQQHHEKKSVMDKVKDKLPGAH